MLARTWSPDELRDPDRLAAQGYAELRGVAGPGPAEANLRNVIHLADAEVLRFGNHVLRVPPTSGLEGLRLAELVDGYQSAATAGPRAFRRAHAALITYLWRLALPRGPLGWLWRAILPNPFRRATNEEVGQLLAFFGQPRTISRVQYRFQREAAGRPPTGSS